MKNKVFVALFLALNISTFGQEYLYFSKNWTPTDKNKADYTREVKKINDTLYKITETNNSGIILMLGEYYSLNPFVENGSFKFLNKESGYDTVTGQYRNGEMVGKWIFESAAREPLYIDYDLSIKECVNSVGQPTDPEDSFVIVEKMPTFKGGSINDFRNYIITKHLQYPPMPAYRHINGKVIVQFTVNKNGEVCHVEISKSSINNDLDKEVLRAVSQSPKWEPGIQRGLPVNVRYSVPFVFELR